MMFSPLFLISSDVAGAGFKYRAHMVARLKKIKKFENERDLADLSQVLLNGTVGKLS